MSAEKFTFPIEKLNASADPRQTFSLDEFVSFLLTRESYVKDPLFTGFVDDALKWLQEQAQGDSSIGWLKHEDGKLYPVFVIVTKPDVLNNEHVVYSPVD